MREMGRRKMQGPSRVGGGDGWWLTTKDGSTGPSPRGRGRHNSTKLATTAYGTIPAWAGATPVRSCRATQRRDHPRVGGGDIWPGQIIVAPLGPSPRGRGRQLYTAPLETYNRTIPAWAGATDASDARRLDHRDHPRVGGGDLDNSFPLAVPQGPSPRGRGRLGRGRHRAGVDGTIPAWAGATPIRFSPIAAIRDHPRVGGGDMRSR